MRQRSSFQPLPPVTGPVLTVADARPWGGLGGGGGGHVTCHIQHSPNTPTTGLRERGNDTSRSTGRSGRQNAATRRNMRRDERVTVQGPVEKQQPDGMSHGGMSEAQGGRVKGMFP